MPYRVTTMGDPEAIEGELLEPEPKKKCACEEPRPTIRGLDDLLLLVNPFVWLAQKTIAGGKAAEDPGVLDRLAASLHVDPVEYAIELTGYTGAGRYWPALKMAGIGVAIAGAGVLAARAIKKRKRKGKRG